ncbi:hypothetical protein [Oceanicaulis sp. MMSF_3324]|uniref:hypothetical protein n=1 Tax=Oceanicaulis sp. MMSF_3324 TaxID=3046702 RepID=UPI00273E8410|nr:hypothetical protein [Oceanicaulis sp. MMSF_3324]
MNDFKRICCFTVGLAALCTGAAQADGRFELHSTNMLTRSDPFSADEELTAFGAGVFDLETGWDSNTWVRRVQPLSGRQVLRFEGQVRLRGYPDRDELNSVLVTPRVQYWNTTSDNTLQLRLSAGYSALSRDGDAHWTRPEAEAQLRWRPEGDRSLETVVRVRANAYDFERANLQGLDSERLRIGVEQFFRPMDEALTVRLSAYFEQADADEERFSFDETRLRGEVVWNIDEKSSAALIADFRDREYDASFSTQEPFAREDERFEIEARYERELTERVNAFVAAGYLDNRSNIRARDYDGATFRAGFSLTL